MLPIKKILVPTDYSDAAESALRYAVELAEKVGAEIELVHVWQLSTYASSTSELAKGMERDLKSDLERLAQRYSGRGVVIHRHLRMGPPYAEIIEAAKDLESDLIVIGTTGRTGLEHFLLGSVAERVVRMAACPVLTVRYKPR